MALVNCPECGKEISDTVKRCPNCGFKIKRKTNKKKLKIVLIAILAVVVVGLIVFLLSSKQREEKKYEELKTQHEKLEEDYASLSYEYAEYSAAIKDIDTFLKQTSNGSYDDLVDYAIDWYTPLQNFSWDDYSCYDSSTDTNVKSPIENSYKAEKRTCSLDKEYSSVSKAYKALVKEDDQLQEKYDALSQKYKKLKKGKGAIDTFTKKTGGSIADLWCFVENQYPLVSYYPWETNDVYGVWVDSVGSVYNFDMDGSVAVTGTATKLIGALGYDASYSYSIDEDNSTLIITATVSGNKYFSTNGSASSSVSYTYKLDGNYMYLTDKESGQTERWTKQ